MHKNNPLKPDQRLQAILALLDEKGQLEVEELAETVRHARRVMAVDVDGIMTDQLEMLRQVVDSAKAIPQAASGQS